MIESMENNNRINERGNYVQLERTQTDFMIELFCFVVFVSFPLCCCVPFLCAVVCIIVFSSIYPKQPTREEKNNILL